MNADSIDQSEPDMPRIQLLLGIPIGLVVLCMMLLVPLDVAARSLFGSPITGAYELIELQLSLVVFGGLPFVSRYGEHVGTLAFPSRWRGVADIVRTLFVMAISIAALLVIGRQLWSEAAAAGRFGASTPALHVPLSPLYYLMALMAWLAALLTGVHTWLQLRPKQAVR